MNWTKPALSALSPITRVRIGSSDASRAAPMTDPVRLPIPPRMTMAKMVSEMENPNRLGVASCRNADRRPPASAASADVMREHAQLEPEHALAERLHGLRVLADAPEHAAVGRLAEAVRQPVA